MEDSSDEKKGTTRDIATVEEEEEVNVNSRSGKEIREGDAEEEGEKGGEKKKKKKKKSESAGRRKQSNEDPEESPRRREKAPSKEKDTEEQHTLRAEPRYSEENEGKTQKKKKRRKADGERKKEQRRSEDANEVFTEPLKNSPVFPKRLLPDDFDFPEPSLSGELATGEPEDDTDGEEPAANSREENSFAHPHKLTGEGADDPDENSPETTESPFSITTTPPPSLDLQERPELPQEELEREMSVTEGWEGGDFPPDSEEDDSSGSFSLTSYLPDPKVFFSTSNPYLPTAFRWLLCLVCFAIVYGSLVVIMGEEALPGSVVFQLILLYYCSWLGSRAVKKVFPALLGSILVGLILSNVPGQLLDPLSSSKLSSVLITLGPTLSFVRAGLSFKLKDLKETAGFTARLSLIPSLLEATLVSVLIHFGLGFPWSWSFMTGFVNSAVSPAIVVPMMLDALIKGYGKQKKIPTFLIMGCVFDPIFTISCFTIFFSLSFSSGESLIWLGFKGVVEVLLGIVIGSAGGLVLKQLRTLEGDRGHCIRFVFLVGGSILAVFLSRHFESMGTGFLSTVLFALFSGRYWKVEQKERVFKELGIFWSYFSPMLFGLIGAAANLRVVNGSDVGVLVGIILAGFVARFFGSLISAYSNTLTWKEIAFVGVAWIPKSTIQATLGIMPRDAAETEEEVERSKIVLLSGILAVVLGASIGSTLIKGLRKKCLKRDLTQAMEAGS